MRGNASLAGMVAPMHAPVPPYITPQQLAMQSALLHEERRKRKLQQQLLLNSQLRAGTPQQPIEPTCRVPPGGVAQDLQSGRSAARSSLAADMDTSPLGGPRYSKDRDAAGRARALSGASGTGAALLGGSGVQPDDLRAALARAGASSRTGGGSSSNGQSTSNGAGGSSKGDQGRSTRRTRSSAQVGNSQGSAPAGGANGGDDTSPNNSDDETKGGPVDEPDTSDAEAEKKQKLKVRVRLGGQSVTESDTDGSATDVDVRAGSSGRASLAQQPPSSS